MWCVGVCVCVVGGGGGGWQHERGFSIDNAIMEIWTLVMAGDTGLEWT